MAERSAPRPTAMLIGDDGGLAREIDSALLELHALGVLDSVDSVVNYPTSEVLVPELARSIDDLGLHVNLSSGGPVSEASLETVAPQGRFLTPSGWVGPGVGLAAALKRLTEEAGKWQLDELEVEVLAQLQRFEELAGYTPRRVSVHHDLDVIGSISDCIYRLSGVKSRHGMLHAGELGAYNYQFAAEGETAESWCRAIREEVDAVDDAVGAPKLIACHPAVSAEGYEDFSAYRQGRVTEYEGLLLLEREA